MIRWLLVLLLALAPAQSGGQGAASEPMLRSLGVEYRGDPPNDEPWLGIWTDDAGNAHVRMAAGHGGVALLTRDGVGYMLRHEDGAGLQEHLLAALIASPAGAQWRAKAGLLRLRQLQIEPAGTERVAGIEGRVYRLRLAEGALRSPYYEIVISTDSRLAPAGREILRFYDSLHAPLLTVTGTEPQPYAVLRGLFAQGTPIRLGRHYRLREIRSEEIPARLFQLPGSVLERDRFIAFLESIGWLRGDEETEYTGGNETMPEYEPANDFLPDDADDPR
jgi:hypothetical protein